MTPRVVVLTPYFRPIVGGVESNAERLARYLHEAGAPVRVLTKRISSDVPDSETLDGIPIARIGPRGQRSPSGKWLMIPHALAWLIRHRSEYNVVCCVDFRGIGLAPLLARLVTRRAVLLQAQTPGAFSGAYAPGGSLGRLAFAPVLAAYRRADAFACIGRALEREALQAGIPRDRIHFLPNPIDMERFRPPSPSERIDVRREFEIPDDAIACVFVGRLSREKGIMELVQAWDNVQHRRAPDARRALLLVAGPDMTGHTWNAGPDARAFVDAQHLGGSVRFLGGGADIPRLLRAADLAIQPSHFEAQGLSAIEALASGVPVVAAAVGGLLDFIADGVNGCLVPPRDPHSLADALIALLDDPPARAALAQQARRSIASNYDEREVFGRLAQLLCRLAEARA